LVLEAVVVVGELVLTMRRRAGLRRRRGRSDRRSCASDGGWTSRRRIRRSLPPVLVWLAMSTARRALVEGREGVSAMGLSQDLATHRSGDPSFAVSVAKADRNELGALSES